MTIIATERRQTIQATFPDGRVFEAPRGTTLEAFMRKADPAVSGQIVAALKNGKLRELSHPLLADADLVPVSTKSSDGVRIYRRSLSFLLIVAIAEVLPERNISIHHSMPFGGYFCACDDFRIFSDEELDALKERMQALADADLPIH